MIYQILWYNLTKTANMSTEISKMTRKMAKKVKLLFLGFQNKNTGDF